MIENISNNANNELIIGNNAIKKQNEVSAIAKAGIKNIYGKKAEFVDQSDISDEAVSLYQKEKDIKKYREIVLESINNDMSTSDIIRLLNEGKYKVSDEDLAGSLSQNRNFLKDLFNNDEVE